MIKNKVKKIFKKNITAYKIWFFLYRHRPSSNRTLPNLQDNFYIDGFPISGNTYIVSFIKNFYPDLVFSHHLHTVAALKIALSNKLECIILLRNPLDAVSSLSIMQSYYGKGSLKDTLFLNQFIIDYIDYYQYVLNNVSSLYILPFESVIDIKKLNPELANMLPVFDKQIPDEKLTSFDKEIREKQKRKPAKRTSTPNKERTQIKAKVKESIQQLDEFETASKLYQKLLEHARTKK